jgi:RimJ/RimL family protein N-acetyltransferase
MNASELARWVTRSSSRLGASICIRPLRADDREREIAFINGLSARSRYLRLFTPLKFLPRHLVDQLMDIDYRQRMALVATRQQDGVEHFVGVARYCETDEPGAAELGISVADAWQRSGIGSLLLRQLISYAREQHIRRLIGLVLPENEPMIALARRLGFTVRYAAGQHLFVMSREITPLRRESGASSPGERPSAQPSSP